MTAPRHWRCVAYAIAGALTGCAAYAQDAAPTVGATGELGALVSVLDAGGLPAVLAVTGWMLGRGGIPVTLQLSADDRNLLRGIARKLASAVAAETDRDDSHDEPGP